MKRMLAVLAATTAMSLVSPAFAADESAQAKTKVDYKKNGGYESTRTTEQKSADGTARTSEANVDVDVDSSGKVDRTVKTESATDPKGLMNKRKDENKTTFEQKERGGYKQITTSKHTDANGTDVTLTTTTDVDVDKDGNVTATAKSEKATDPKGLLNKSTSTSKTKSVNGRVVEQKKEAN